jgi:hypothetical protein
MVFEREKEEFLDYGAVPLNVNGCPELGATLK